MRRFITTVLVIVTVTATLTYRIFWGLGDTHPAQAAPTTSTSASTPAASPSTPFNGDALSRVQAALAKSGKPIVIPPPSQPSPPSPSASGNADPSNGLERVPHEPPKPGEVRTMGIKQLGNFEYDPIKGGDVPADVKALTGMKVRLNGYMFPLDDAQKVSNFILVPSLTSCCYGQPPGVQHVITVRIPKDKAIDPVIDEIIVEGTLRVNVIREDDYTSSIFELDATSAKLAPQ